MLTPQNGNLPPLCSLYLLTFPFSTKVTALHKLLVGLFFKKKSSQTNFPSSSPFPFFSLFLPSFSPSFSWAQGDKNCCSIPAEDEHRRNLKKQEPTFSVAVIRQEGWIGNQPHGHLILVSAENEGRPAGWLGHRAWEMAAAPVHVSTLAYLISKLKKKKKGPEDSSILLTLQHDCENQGSGWAPQTMQLFLQYCYTYLLLLLSQKTLSINNLYKYRLQAYFYIWGKTLVLTEAVFCGIIFT